MSLRRKNVVRTVQVIFGLINILFAASVIYLQELMQQMKK